MRLYHGAHTSFVPHPGQCYTDNEDYAKSFSGVSGELGMVEVNLDLLRIFEDEPYDHDTNDHPSDHESYCDKLRTQGYDMVVYEDEDEFGHQITCYRFLINPKNYVVV